MTLAVDTIETEVERAQLDVPEPPLGIDARPMIERPAVRFAATLAANVLRAGLSFVTGILIARSLGAARYGDLNFLLGSFAAVIQILDAGTTSAFYTLMSSRRRTPLFFAAYFAWTFGVQFGGTMLVVGLLLPKGAIARLWLGHDRASVLLAFAASFMVAQTWNSVAQMGEAARKTAAVQLAASGQALVHLALIVAAIEMKWLSVTAVLWLITLEYLATAFLFGPRMMRHHLGGEPEPLGAITKQFTAYCKPIVVYCLVTFLYQFADRWLLQRFGGSVQQAFFAVGQQFAAISLLATTSIVNVFWKEIAEANEKGDHERMRAIYGSVRRVLYFGAAAISCALIPYSREILRWTVGDKYESGALCLALMFLYPIHQALGYIQGTFYLATRETTRYTLVGLGMMIVSIPTTYLMVGPLALGAVGVAVKMVVLQVLGIAAQMVLLKRSHGFGYDYGYQAAVIALLLALAFGIKTAFTFAIANPFVVALLGGIVYAAIIGVFVWRKPSLAGLSPLHIEQLTARFKR